MPVPSTTYRAAAYMMRPMTAEEEERAFAATDGALDPCFDTRKELYRILLAALLRAREGSKDALRDLQSDVFLAIANASRVTLNDLVIEKAVMYADVHGRPDQNVVAGLGPHVV